MHLFVTDPNSDPHAQNCDECGKPKSEHEAPPVRIHQATARKIGKQLLAVATTKEQKAIALYWTGCTMDLLKKHGLTLEEYFKFNDGNLKTGGAI